MTRRLFLLVHFLFWKLQIVNIYTKTVTVGIPPEFRTSITFNGLTHL